MERTKANAGILALCTGFVGVHRFFLYRPGTGVLYLIPGYAALATLVSWFVRDENGFQKNAADTLAFAGTVHDGLALYAILLLLVLVFVSWMEAIRFFTLHEDRFRQKYVSDAPRVAEDEARKERIVIDTHKTRATAFVLALCLGWIAIQRFYLARFGTGVLGALLGVSGIALIPTALVLEEDPLLFAGIGLVALVWVLSIINGFRILALRDRVFRYRYGRPVDEAQT